MWFELILAAALVIVYVAFWAWHSQGAGKLTQAEIDQYIAIIEKLPLPEKAVQAFIARLRPWAEADDGRPVYMFNLIRFLPKLQMFPKAPEFNGTPHKFIAVELDLVPVSSSTVVPDLRWLVGGGFAIVF